MTKVLNLISDTAMKNRSLGSQQEIDEIIKKCQVCHIAMADPDGIPYVIPMNFGYRNGIIYLHSSRHGKKIDILKANPEDLYRFQHRLSPEIPA